MGIDYLPGNFFEFSENLSIKPLTTQVAVLEYEYDKTKKIPGGKGHGRKD